MRRTSRRAHTRDRVSLELADPQHGLETLDDDPHKVGEHVLRVLELGAEQVARVAGDVRQDKRAALRGDQLWPEYGLAGHRAIVSRR